MVIISILMRQKYSFAFNLFSSRHSDDGLLFTNEVQKKAQLMSVMTYMYTSATHASHIHDAIGVGKMAASSLTSVLSHDCQHQLKEKKTTHTHTQTKKQPQKNPLLCLHFQNDRY